MEVVRNIGLGYDSEGILREGEGREMEIKMMGVAGLRVNTHPRDTRFLLSSPIGFKLAFKF